MSTPGGKYSLARFRAFAPLLRIEDGSPLKLEPFQIAMLRDHFGPARELVAVIPKKNGKTTLLASLALFHIAEVRDAECLIAASSRDQAGIMFRQAVSMLKRSAVVDANDKKLFRIGGHEYRILDGYREIRCNGGRIKVMAADEDTGDGIIPTLGLIDELHRAQNGNLYGVFSDGLGPRGGRIVTISTAGYNPTSPLGILRERAHAHGGVKKGRHLRVADGAFIFHEWALDLEDDPSNLRQVKRANPSSMQTVAELARRRATPSMTTGRWLRFACGIWTPGEEPAILPAEWDMLRADIGQIVDGEDVILAPSVGGNAAVAVAATRPDDKVATKVFHIPSQDGRHIHALTEDLIVDLCERYSVSEVFIPEGGFSRTGANLEDRGVPVVAAHPSPSRLVGATGTFDRLLRERKLIHDGDSTTRTQVLAAVKKSTETGERYVPGDSSRAIGALAIAAHAVADYSPPLLVIFGDRMKLLDGLKDALVMQSEPDAVFEVDVPAELMEAMTAGGVLAPRVTRAMALQVPAVLRGRNLIAGTLAGLPIHVRDKERKIVEPTTLMAQIDPDIPNVVTLAETYEDLIFEGVSWWKVVKFGWHGFPELAVHVDPNRVQVMGWTPPVNGQSPSTAVGPTSVRIDGYPVPDNQIIRFDSPNPPLLKHAARAIRQCLNLDMTASAYSDDPVPLGYLTPRDGMHPKEDKNTIEDTLDSWQEARRRRAWAYVGASLELKSLAFNAEQIQLAEQRQHAVLEIARAFGIDPEDLGVSTTSRTYQNSEQRRQDLIDFTFAPFMHAVEQRLSMRDVLPRGYEAKVNLDSFLRSDTKGRMDAYKVGLEVGAYTEPEIRVLEDRPDIPKSERPAPAPMPAAPQPAEEAT